MNSTIDAGRPFDFGRTSSDYARYRDIYPEIFYRKIADKGLCVNGQKVLDIGTGTGVLPRNMYHYGAEWTGIDISAEQIEQAKRLSEAEGMNISFQVKAAEDIDFPPESFDIVTACQCFWYFDSKTVIPRIADILKDDGILLLLIMEWLPFEDEIAGESEKLVLKYNPEWTGAGETRKPVHIPDIAYDYFELTDHEEYDINVPFTRESWNGRMKTCRGIGASLSPAEITEWEKEHKKFLQMNAPKNFTVLHFAASATLKKKK
jgi:SAM-dependent methyltransferase